MAPSDPLFLQIKEEPASAYAPYLPDATPPQHNGQRVAEGQRAMQLQSDPFLGWTHIGGRHYLVRQLNDHKGSIELADMAGADLEAYAEVCGELLARGHARSGDPLVIAGYLGSGVERSKARSHPETARASAILWPRGWPRFICPPSLPSIARRPGGSRLSGRLVHPPGDGSDGQGHKHLLQPKSPGFVFRCQRQIRRRKS